MAVFRELVIFVPQKQSFLYIMEVRVINKSHHPLPQYATSDSAGMDLRANLDSPIVLKPLERCLVPTGLYIALPHGTEAQIRPRSGLALKKGITVLNSPGTIDADYRGEICIILVNLSSEPFEIRDGERIAQMVVASYEQAGWKPVESLDAYETVAEQQENSYIGQLGRGIEPVIKPLGFDWKLGIGLLSGVGAKELVVSTLGVLYADDPDADSVSLAERIPITPLVAFCYMLFVLIYFPCIAAIAAIKQESGSWKWALFAACYTTGLAWLVSFAVYQIGGLFV